MNSFIKNNKQFFSLLLSLVLHNSLSALTFKNEPLTNFIRPGEMAHATFPENSFIVLDMESDNFDVRHGNIENLEHLNEIFQQVRTGRSGCSMSSRILNASSNIVDYNSSYLNGQECINIKGKTSLQFINCLLESPLISITGNKMNFVDSFLINPKVLNIIVDIPGSDYDIIQILFYDQPENPTVITGKIDLNNNQTTKGLIISNVKEINVQFKWDKNVPQESNIKEAPAVTKFSPQPSHTSYQWPYKQFLKEVMGHLLSPKLYHVTLPGAALLLYAAYQGHIFQ